MINMYITVLLTREICMVILLTLQNSMQEYRHVKYVVNFKKKIIFLLFRIFDNTSCVYVLVCTCISFPLGRNLLN